MDKIPWFAQLTTKKMGREWDELIVKRSDEGWSKETYENHMAALLEKHGFRFRNEDDTLFQARKIWDKHYNENDLDNEY